MQKAYYFSTLLLALLLLSTACSRKTAKNTFNIGLDGPMPNGAWTRQVDEDNKKITEVLLFVDGFFSLTRHEAGSGAFIMSKGGSFSKAGMELNPFLEFNSADAERVGKLEFWSMEVKGDQLSLIMGTDTGLWTPLDIGKDSPLVGAWLFSGRERNGEMQRRETNIPRKTMKMLTATRFQWIAFNTETGEFSGTGGGEYTAENGKYVEKIRFFSRDDNRVGAELPFEFRVEGEDWHHSGKSSSGDPMYEIWTKRKK